MALIQLERAKPREKDTAIRTVDIQRIPPREPVANHVHRELRRAILMGQFSPGSRLIEVTLAAMLNVSRTPIREAISKLETEGLVKRAGGRGVVVEDASGRLFEIITIRQGLEGAAVRLACQRASDEELAAILAFERDAVTPTNSVSVEDRAEHNRLFHAALARASGSARLVSLLEEFYEYSFGELMPHGTPAELNRLRRQHIAIAENLVRRNAEAAEQVVREHLETIVHIFEKRSIK